jgi:hypothetical protein
VEPSARLPEGIDDRRVAASAVSPTTDVTERHVSEVAQFLDLDGVIREGTEEIGPQSRRLNASYARYASSTFSCDIARPVSREGRGCLP